MITVSEEFKEAVWQDHEVITKMEILVNGIAVREVTEIVDGSITADISNSVRRRCTVTVIDVDGDLTPTDPSDLLAPYGNEVKLYRGIMLPGGPEYVPQGVFRIGRVNKSGGGADRKINFEGYDRSRAVSKYRFEESYVVAKGTNYATAATALVKSALPGVVVNFPSTTNNTPLLVFDEMEDRWEALEKMAKSLGLEVFFDVNGAVVMEQEPDLETAEPVAEYIGDYKDTLLEISQDSDDEGVYSIAIVTGENSSNDTPYRGYAKDTDPSSPTYADGKFGKVPTWLRSQFIASTAQAQAAAEALLRRASRRSVESLDITQIVNPAHEEGDIIRVIDEDTGINALCMIESLTIPLEVGGTMSVSARTGRVYSESAGEEEVA